MLEKLHHGRKLNLNREEGKQWNTFILSLTYYDRLRLNKVPSAWVAKNQVNKIPITLEQSLLHKMNKRTVFQSWLLFLLARCLLDKQIIL